MSNQQINRNYEKHENKSLKFKWAIDSNYKSKFNPPEINVCLELFSSF